MHLPILMRSLLSDNPKNPQNSYLGASIAVFHKAYAKRETMTVQDIFKALMFFFIYIIIIKLIFF